MDNVCVNWLPSCYLLKCRTPHYQKARTLINTAGAHNKQDKPDTVKEVK